MKTKILSFLLMLSLLVSVFAVYPGLTIETSAATKLKDYVHLRMSYGDGDDDFGSIGNLINSKSSSFTTVAEDNNNYGFLDVQDAANVYFPINVTASRSPSETQSGYLIFELDINDFGKSVSTSAFLEVVTGTSSRKFAKDIINIASNGTANYLYCFNNTAKKMPLTPNEWNHVRIEFYYAAGSSTYSCKVIVGDISYENTYNMGTPAVFNQFRIGSTKISEFTPVQIGLDNITLYSCHNLKDSYQDIGTLTNILAMKVGIKNALVKKDKIVLDNAPVLVDGVAYAPVAAVELFAGKILSNDKVVNFEGVDYISTNDIPAAFNTQCTYDNMGLIIVSPDVSEFDRNYDMEGLVNIMKQFVFDIPTAESLREDVEEHTGFNHPYLLADEERFAELKSIYKAGKSGSLTNPEEKLLYSYITKIVDTAESNYNSWANGSDVAYNGLKRKPVNSNYDTYNNNGYDIGGRLTVPSSILTNLAFAYQMTDNINYAKLVYDYSLALGEWNHWGPGHFLNCADGAYPVALAYDWCYDAFTELNSKGELAKYDGEIYDQAKIAKILFTHAILPGYIQTMNVPCPWPRWQSDSQYATKESNWNAVCTAGMVAAGLAIINQDIPTAGLSFKTQTRKSTQGFTESVTLMGAIGNTVIHKNLYTYADYAAKLLSINLGGMVNYGLSQYVPDGSYIESAGYWAYGTNSLYRMIEYLVSATGDDYGFMDSWGMDKTTLFAIHAESSDYRAWSYHDGGTSAMDLSHALFVGSFYGDDNLIKVRKNQLNNGKSSTLYDIIFYDTSITGDAKLDLDYYMEGIDGFATRSSWEKGALYAGLMGGSNSVSHGQIDAGSFVYHNGGNIWFHDLGSDNYNISEGYFGNYNLYVQSAEGHNVICLVDEETDVPYGQVRYSTSPIVDYDTFGDDGSYAIINTAEAYGAHAKRAKRGMLLTNSRQTLIIQDEITFNGKKSAYWFGHYMLGDSYVDSVMLSADGRTAFMKQDDKLLRVSIVCSDENAKFEIMDCYTYVLDGTYRTDKTTMGGALTEKNRDSYRKLAIKFTDVTTINLAVVIEPVSDYSLDTSYTWTNMSSWEVNSLDTEEEKLNASVDFDDINNQVGAVQISSPDNSIASTFINNSGNYLFVTSNSDSTRLQTSELALICEQGANVTLGRLNRAFALNLDIGTQSHFEAGSEFILKIKDAIGNDSDFKLATLEGTSIKLGGKTIDVSRSFAHITVIYLEETDTAYVYANGEFLTSVDNIPLLEGAQFYGIGIKYQTNYLADRTASVALDNFSISSYGTLFDTGELKTIVSGKNDITEWSKNGYKPEKTPDYLSFAISDGSSISTMSIFTDMLYSGKQISLTNDIPLSINIEKECSIDTCGYSLAFTSPNYIACYDGTVVSFKKGVIEVVWHIGDEVYKTYCSSSTKAEFTKDNDKVGKITESTYVDSNGNTRYVFNTTGWASSEGGSILDDSELIISNRNREFWLVDGKPYNAPFVTKDPDGNIYPGYTDQDFANAMSLNSDNYKTIILCSNYTLNRTSSIPLAGEGKNVYLNGYTLTSKYEGHTFTFNNYSNASINFYGPGMINKSSSSGTLLITSSSSIDTDVNAGVNFHGIDLVFNYELADIRIGHHTFTNCNITQVGDAYSGHTFLIWNKNSGYNSNGEAYNRPSISIDNCVVTRNSARSAYIMSSTGGYAEFNVKDSVLSNPTGGIFTAADENSVMTVIGESRINANNIRKATDECKVVLNKDTMLNIEPSEDMLAIRTNGSRCKVAKSYSPLYIYEVCYTTYTVEWLDLAGNLLESEIYAVGCTPSIKGTTAEGYLDYINSGDITYTYNVTAMSHTGKISFSPEILIESGILMNLTLDSCFDMNIYIPVDLLASLTLNGETVDTKLLKAIKINEKDYMQLVIDDISPECAGKSYTITVTTPDGKSIVESFSLIEYLDNLLNNKNESHESHILAANILQYINSVYIYTNASSSDEYPAIKAIIDKHSNAFAVFESFSKEQTDIDSISFAIKSAKLSLKSKISYRFTINEGYTGDITFRIGEMSKTVSISQGLTDEGERYIYIDVPIPLLSETVTITVGERTANYSFDCYASAICSHSLEIRNILFYLKNYQKAAELYRESL